MKLVSVPEMRAIEKEADANGLTYEMMMENAGRNLAREVLRLSYAQGDGEEDAQVLGLVGSGNNGGDTLVALTSMAEKGWTARAYLVKRKSSGDPLLKRFEEAGGEFYLAGEDENFQQLQSFLEAADIILDGVVGTGFQLPLKDDVGKVLSAVQGFLAGLDWPPSVVAVDCPSGVDSDSGSAASQAIPADATVTMAAIKRGLLKLPAYNLIGELRVVEIGSLDELSTWRSIQNEVADEGMALALLPERPADAHKGTFGTALVVAGSVNYTGAVLMAGKAAYRAGAGLVTLAVPTPLHAALAGQLPEATWVLLPHETGVIASGAADVLMKNLERATALLLGPGLGMEDTTREFLSNLLSSTAARPVSGRMGFIPSAGAKPDPKPVVLPPLVIDADGLKLLTKLADWPRLLPASTILTPHPGEMAVLTGLKTEEIQKDRLAFASHYAKEWGHIVVLKGAFTVIAAPDGRTTTIPVATPALAHAGTGDVLAGIIVGLRAQGVSAYDAARLGAWIHVQAGLIAAESMGSTAVLLAGDVLEAIPEVIAGLGKV